MLCHRLIQLEQPNQAEQCSDKEIPCLEIRFSFGSVLQFVKNCLVQEQVGRPVEKSARGDLWHICSPDAHTSWCILWRDLLHIAISWTQPTLPRQISECVSSSVHEYMSVSMSLSLSASLSVRACVCACAGAMQMHTYKHSRIHVHIHTYIHRCIHMHKYIIHTYIQYVNKHAYKRTPVPTTHAYT